MSYIKNKETLCYDYLRKKWYACEESNVISRRGIIGGGGAPSPGCCITPASLCCINCADLFKIKSCVELSLVTEVIPQSPYNTIDMDGLVSLWNPTAGTCGWAAFGGPAGVSPIRIRNLTTGISTCVVDLTMNNANYVLNNPGDTITQCMNIENDCNGGAGVSVGICWQVQIVDVGAPGSWTVEYSNFKICTNPSIDEITACVECYQ